MMFEELKEKIDKLNCESNEALTEFEKNLNLTVEKFDELIQDLFSEKINNLDMNKVPYVIDKLYQSNDKLNFMLCCVLIEATCFDLPFITNLENYPLFEAKYEVLKNTLITVYENVDNGIANCMSLIILNNDPIFKLLEPEEKQKMINATKLKLKDIIAYLKNTEEINEIVYNDLEIIIDLACHMKDSEIDGQIEELLLLPLNFSCRLFIAKYKLINKKCIKEEEIENLINDRTEIDRVVSIFEKNEGIEQLADYQINQEEIAKANMINWLKYPTELGQEPDEIQLLGNIEIDNEIVYIYKFKSEIFKDKGEMIGISGAYQKNKITSITSGLTFSKFETVEGDFIKQGKELAEFIMEAWKNRAKNNN